MRFAANRIALSLCLAAAAFLPARAAAPLVTVRAESLDAALADIEKVMKSAGKETSRAALLAQVAQALGVPDLSFVDMGRPVAIAMPLEGMALGVQGFVFALPVKDGAIALEALASRFPERAQDGDLHVFRDPPPPAEEGPVAEGEEEDAGPAAVAGATYARVRERVLLVGRNADLVRGFDPADALAGADLPKMPLVAAVQIEPIAPLIKAGLMMAKQKIDELPAAPPSPPAEGEGAAPAPPAVDPKALAPLLDLYFGILQDGIDNLSSFQVGLDATDRHLQFQTRAVAKLDSPLARFFAAQRDAAIPAIGRMLPADAALMMAGQVVWTDPARAWAVELVRSYRGAALPLMSQLAGPVMEDASLRAWLEISMDERLVACQRGDMASAMDFNGPQGGMRMVQIAGLRDAPGCASLLDDIAAGLTKPAAGAAGATGAKGAAGGLTVTAETLQPEKIKTFVLKLELAADPESPLSRVYGGEGGLTLRYARVGALLISGTEPWATTAIREAAARPEGLGGGGGLVLADLGPYTAGPGVFGRFDVGTLMRGLRDVQPEADRAALPLELLDALAGPSGRIPFALRSDGRAGTMEFALPLAMFEAFAKYLPEEPPADEDDAFEDGDEDVDDGAAYLPEGAIEGTE